MIAGIEDWPYPGDEVLFNAGGRWVPALVLGTMPEGKGLRLKTSGAEVTNALHGRHNYGWQLYEEMAASG